MRVDLRALQPNPLRDFAVDPIDPAQVDILTQSINTDGFWGGVACRQLSDGTLQIAAGHHQVHAALAAGITEADVFVAEAMGDAAMVRTYVRENATARGMTSTAQAGMVASTIRLLAKAILTGHVSRILETSPKAEEVLRGQLASDKGLGEHILVQFLQGIPRMTQHIIRGHLGNLKASGDYARILREVQEELAREQASREAREAAQAVADTAAQQERIFDFEGVAKHLRNSHQLDVFRKTVTGPGIKPSVPVAAQAALAQQLVEQAHGDNREISGAYIYDQLTSKFMFAKFQARQQTRKEEEYLRRESLVRQAKGAQDDLVSHLYGVGVAGMKVAKLYLKWPKGLKFPMTAKFPHALKHAKAVLDRLVAMMYPSTSNEPSPDAEPPRNAP
jgi:hypothetical protein